METYISERVKKGMVMGSWIRRMFEEGNVLKQQYGDEKVFDLSIGNPVVEPPPQFYRELKKLVNKPVPGMHRYMENAGYRETREAVAEQMTGETGIKFRAGEIVMTCGAAGALNVILKTLLNPGEEVIVFTPYFLEFCNYVDNHNGVCTAVPTDENFLPRLDAFESAITARTKVVLINTPNNPTGVVYDEKLLHDLGEILSKKEAELGTRIFLVSDEAYRRLIYDGQKFPAVLHHHNQTIVAASHSKDLALPGERIGYIAIHPDCASKEELLNGFIFCNRTLGFVNAPALMQRVVARLQGVSVSIADYQEKRDFLYHHLCVMGYSVVKPQGAFYMFPKSPIPDEIEFVRELQKWRVLTVPGVAFGQAGYFRLSYCVTDKTLEGALQGFRKAAEKFGLGRVG
ncbi:MAG: pyridoxal phosphate-dependent aminotransferase [Dehalococcoidia bacterium]|nr:pyridoxal phosphate-dependent aminotransferase [Dehalococcoidia bacterium]